MRACLLAAALLAGALAASPALAAAPKLTVEQRLQRLEDETEIRRILVQYGAYLDAREFGKYAALFAKNGEWIGGYGHFTGPAQIQKMLEERIGKGGPTYINLDSYHLMSNPLIEIDGEKARSCRNSCRCAAQPTTGRSRASRAATSTTSCARTASGRSAAASPTDRSHIATGTSR